MITNNPFNPHLPCELLKISNRLSINIIGVKVHVTTAHE